MLRFLCGQVPDQRKAKSIGASCRAGALAQWAPDIRLGWNRAILGVTTLGTLLFPKLAAAELEDLLSYDFHGIVLQPQLDLNETYTDNLTYSRGVGQVSDLQTTFAPGLRMQVGDSSDVYARVELGHDEVVFLDHSESNYRQNRLRSEALYRTARLLFNFSQSYDQLSGFLGGIIGQSGAINVAPRRRNLWYGTFRTTYDGSARTDLYFDFSNYVTDWAKDVALYDYNTLRGALGGTYELTDRLQVFSEFAYGQSGVTANQRGQVRGIPSATYGAFVGLRGEFTTRFSGTAKFGMENRTFFERDRSGTLIPAFDFDVRYSFSEATAVQLQYNRLTSPSVNFGGQSVTLDAATLTATHFLGGAGSWFIKASSTYQLADYSNTAAPALPSTARTDDYITAEVGLYYRPRPWLTVSAGYAIEIYQVNFQNPLLALRNLTGYEANRVFLNLSLGF